MHDLDAGLRGRKIAQYRDEELDAVIEIGVLRVPGFWIMVRAIDAFFERRRRRDALPERDRLFAESLDRIYGIDGAVEGRR